MLLLIILLGAFAAQADVIGYYSGDGLNEFNLHNLVIGNNVLINPDPVWMAAFPGSHWISYANTGNPGTVSPPNAAIPGAPTASFFEVLPLGTYYLTLNVLADDTAGVYLEDLSNPLGLLLKAPNPLQDGHCAAGQIGCEVGENWMGSSAVNPNGFARVRYEVYQRGGGPYGLDYNGTASTVPEPGSAWLLATGGVLFGIARLPNWLRRRRNR
ncbi:MAG: hypothetical protein M1333_01310 [Patescibacteria group bacterium]|nr:hypothetical protein [Patescibacteria group bacterium]